MERFSALKENLDDWVGQDAQRQPVAQDGRSVGPLGTNPAWDVERAPDLYPRSKLSHCLCRARYR